MKLFYDKKSKDPTYYAQQGFRNGKKTSTRNVKNFGKHSELLKITDDPLSYVQEEIRKMNEEYRVGKADFEIKVNFNEKVKSSDDDTSSSTSSNIGYYYLQDIMKGLQLKKFFENATSNRKNTFDCYTISRFLTYARILDPKSKLGTWDNLDSYYEKPSFSYQHIMRFMDTLEENYDTYLSWLYQNSNNIIKRDTSVLYYDCTNFYFECESEDDIVIDEVTEEIIQGLRKYGTSKEHRPNPIVEMGLFMDQRGIPISMCLHPGNTSEQLTAIPLEKEITKMIGNAKFIYCADAGLGSYHIRQFNSMGGRAFIVTQSIKKLSDTLKEAVFNDEDYRLLSNNTKVSVNEMKAFDRFEVKNKAMYEDFAYKVFTADKMVDLGLYEDKVLKNGKVKKVKMLNSATENCHAIQLEMNRLAAQLPEYDTVMSMYGVGKAVGPQLIAELGDPRRFHSRKAITAYFGYDSENNDSGQKVSISNSMTKKGAGALRRTLFIIMQVLLKNKPVANPVYDFLIKKQSEGKHYYSYMNAAANKFLRIYYARVKEVLTAAEASA